MTISVNWSSAPYLITIPQSDLTFVSGTIYQITVNFLWQLLRDFADSEEAIPRPTLFTNIPPTASTPRIVEINDDYYRVQFENGNYSVDIINGNTNFRDVEVKNNVSVGTNNTTGFINPTFLESGLFEGGVAIDVINGVAGTGYTNEGAIIGTRQTPVNNLADAEVIATYRGLRDFFILSSMTLSTVDVSHGHRFLGDSPVTITITVDPSANISNCEFINITIQGTLDGGNVLRQCIVLNINYLNGFLQECAINGTITLGGNSQASIWNCFSNIAGGGAGQYPTVDMNSSGTSLVIRNYYGGIQISNYNGSNSSSIDLSSGRVIFASSVVSGSFYVRGIGFIEDNSTGTANIVDQTVNNQNTAIAVWNEQLSNHVDIGSAGLALSTAGAGGLTPTQATMLLELYKIMGLDPTKPLIVDDDGDRRFVGSSGSPDIDQTVVTVGNTTTVTRTI